jgi:hypothetical protein
MPHWASHIPLSGDANSRALNEEWGIFPHGLEKVPLISASAAGNAVSATNLSRYVVA